VTGKCKLSSKMKSACLMSGINLAAVRLCVTERPCHCNTRTTVDPICERDLQHWLH